MCSLWAPGPPALSRLRSCRSSPASPRGSWSAAAGGSPRARVLRPPPLAPLSSAEIAALRASCPPAEGRDADGAVARALLDAPNAYATALLP